MSKFKRIIAFLLAIISFCVLELASPLGILAEEKSINNAFQSTAEDWNNCI